MHTSCFLQYCGKYAFFHVFAGILVPSQVTQIKRILIPHIRQGFAPLSHKHPDKLGVALPAGQKHRISGCLSRRITLIKQEHSPLPVMLADA